MNPYVAGLGCRRGCDPAELRALLDRALAECGLHVRDLAGLASLDRKRDEPGLLSLAHSLGLPLAFFEAGFLATYADRLQRPSQQVLREVGSAGVAEACALAQADALGLAPARLRLEKRNSARASVAIARVATEGDAP
ncbi:cobalamin biosynthesis protein [Pseudomonas alcaligenes]|uniref:cobalamin biosynthesis protein n=1 Tax=Pseudomonas sp. RIT-PI-AD TaxID=3035294 RepID=UPI0021D9A9D3